MFYAVIAAQLTEPQLNLHQGPSYRDLIDHTHLKIFKDLHKH